MTEEEAKTKACFQARTFGGSQQLAEGPGPHCIASACMAWRWADSGLQVGEIVERIRAHPLSAKPGPEWGYEAADPNSASAGGDWVRREVSIATKPGFCGLAGVSQ